MFYLREKIDEAQKRKHVPLAGSTTFILQGRTLEVTNIQYISWAKEEAKLQKIIY